MRFMIIEHFHPNDLRRIYARFSESGRQLPDGLVYVDSWVSNRMDTCYQLMECDDLRLLDEWMARWRDIVRFEVVPVITTAEAAARALGGGGPAGETERGAAGR